MQQLIDKTKYYKQAIVLAKNIISDEPSEYFVKDLSYLNGTWIGKDFEFITLPNYDTSLEFNIKYYLDNNFYKGPGGWPDNVLVDIIGII